MTNLQENDPLPEQGDTTKTSTTQKLNSRRAAGRKPKQADPGTGDRLLLGYRVDEAAAPIGFGGPAAPVAAAGAPVWLEGEGHVITIAPTGAGKGRGALIPNLLTYEGPAIVIDPKGEACRVTARRRREMGQEVHVIDPFGVVSDQSDSLNPMDAFDIAGIEPSSLAMEIAKQLSGGKMSLPDPFWDIRGHDLAAGVISAVASVHEGADRTLQRVRKYLKSDDANYNLAVVLDTVGKKIHRFAYEEIASYLQTEDRCRSGIHATACSYFSVIASDAAQRTITCSTIDLQAVTRGDPMTIYLVVPPSKLASHAALFRLWTASLLSAVLSRETDLPEHRTLFAIDECAQLGDFGLLPMVYTLARSYGVRVWAFFQDLAQIKRMLPDEWQTVLTNSAALQVFGVPNHLMASDLAQVLGDFSEDELRGMDRTHLALQVAGCRGITARRPDYLMDPMYQGLFDPHPMMKGRKPAEPGKGTIFG
ncbi:MAG: type IV secretory system conjugative DNA transfer family protein [Hyphomonas sp.]|nr:type IV secretory system conjugative DNA transfer family protein [Hyphomonas sp.]